MNLVEDERILLEELRAAKDGVLKTRMIPDDVVKRLAAKKAIVNVLTAMLGPGGPNGGVSLWKITNTGLEMLSS